MPFDVALARSRTGVELRGEAAAATLLHAVADVHRDRTRVGLGHGGSRGGFLGLAVEVGIGQHVPAVLEPLAEGIRGGLGTGLLLLPGQLLG